MRNYPLVICKTRNITCIRNSRTLNTVKYRTNLHAGEFSKGLLNIERRNLKLNRASKRVLDIKRLDLELNMASQLVLDIERWNLNVVLAIER